MKKLACILALSSAFVSGQALAWGADGHATVGAIADQLIAGSNAEKQVAALLLPGESLASIASWADCVKGSYCGPQTQEMKDYVAANPQHSEYHYTDVPFQDAHYTDGAVGTKPDDIVQTLKQAIATLEGKDDDSSNPHHFTKRQALLLLVHLTGDIHQPLHVGAAYIGADGSFVVPQQQAQIDAVHIFDAVGGNDLMMDQAKLDADGTRLIPVLPVEADAKPQHAPFKSATKPFHSYWDSTVVDYAFRRIGVHKPEQFAQAVIATKPGVAANTGDPLTWPYQWADDALGVAKQAYDGVTAGQSSMQTTREGKSYKVWALNVPDNYPLPSSDIAKQQLIKGGYHLAEVLQAIWP